MNCHSNFVDPLLTDQIHDCCYMQYIVCKLDCQLTIRFSSPNINKSSKSKDLNGWYKALFWLHKIADSHNVQNQMNSKYKSLK